MSATAGLLRKSKSIDEEFEEPEHVAARTAAYQGRPRTRSTATYRSFATDKSLQDTSKSAYIYAIAIALPISLVAFTVQTELAQYIQRDLHYEKPYFMLYITHSSWFINGIAQLAWLRVQHWSVPTRTVLLSALGNVKGTAETIARTTGYDHRPLHLHFSWVIALCGVCLTIAGATWYVAVNMTTASDLSAIYNSSAFFAYAFSVPILKERVRKDKMVAVILAIVGVFIIAYGDRGASDTEPSEASDRALGNVVIAVGAILYGLYEVLYKKYGCPPPHYSPERSIVFANAMASGLATFTLSIMWIPIPLLHILGWETFQLPPREAIVPLVVSIGANFVYSACLLAMISLTSPVLSSVACLLSIFVVAITDTFVTGRPLTPAAVAGGLVIGAAFAVLSCTKSAFPYVVLILTGATYTETIAEQQDQYIDESDIEDNADGMTQ